MLHKITIIDRADVLKRLYQRYLEVLANHIYSQFKNTFIIGEKHSKPIYNKSSLCKVFEACLPCQICLLCLFSLFWCLFPWNSLADQLAAVKSGDCSPNILLRGLLSLEDEKYLGISSRKAVSLSDIHASFLLIEGFSIYCPICQKHATKFNQLYDLVQRDNFVSRNMKMIGIGMGNNGKEVAYFRKYFNIPFPVFCDPDFKVYAVFKKTRVPLVVILDKRSSPYKILTILDFTKKPETLIEDIRAELHKIKPGH